MIRVILEFRKVSINFSFQFYNHRLYIYCHLSYQKSRGVSKRATILYEFDRAMNITLSAPIFQTRIQEVQSAGGPRRVIAK